MTATKRREPEIPWSERELLNSAQLAVVLGVSRKKIGELLREGVIPAPVKIVRGKYSFRLREYQSWIAAGLPSLSSWRWRETLPQNLDDLIRSKHAEIQRLERIITELQPQAARLEQLANADVG